MATLDYNSGNGPVTFFPSNVSHPVRFCDHNKGGIQIATHGLEPRENTIQLGNTSSAFNVSGISNFDLIQVGETTIRSTEINLDNLTLSNKGLDASGLLLNVQNGSLNVSGSMLLSDSAGGNNSQYLSISVNGKNYKIALHEV
jgi:hypothetical protein